MEVASQFAQLDSCGLSAQLAGFSGPGWREGGGCICAETYARSRGPAPVHTAATRARSYASFLVPSGQHWAASSAPASVHLALAHLFFGPRLSWAGLLLLTAACTVVTSTCASQGIFCAVPFESSYPAENRSSCSQHRPALSSPQSLAVVTPLLVLC